MKTKKQELMDNPQEWINNDTLDTLNCSYIKPTATFFLQFNGKGFCYKTWNGFVKKRKELTEKHNLILRSQL